MKMNMFSTRCFIFVFGCLAAFPAIAAQPASQPVAAADANRPVIQTAEPIHNFGATWVGGPLKHSFAITNTGKAVLEISRVSPSCGCTTVGDYPKKLEPGQSGQFSFTLDSQKLHGAYSKNITIHSNDPQTPQLKLTLKGECKHQIDVSPASAG